LILRSVKVLHKKYSKLTHNLKGYNPIIRTRSLDDFEIYNWFPYTQRFTSEFLRRVFNREEFMKSNNVLDPFMGSGNTLVACVEFGKNGFGIDVSPLFWFITTVKTTKYSVDDFNKAIATVSNANKVEQLDPPLLSSFSKLFEKKQLNELLTLRELAYELPAKPKMILLFALASKLIDFSKAKRYGKGLHFKAGKEKTLEIKKTIITKIKKMQRSYFKFNHKGEAFPILADARKLPLKIKDKNISEGQIDIIFTSPPYCNSSDYIEMYKLEHWFLNFISTYEEFKKMSYSTIRSHTTFVNDDFDWSHPVLDEISLTLNGFKNNLWSKKIPLMILGYFDDLYKSLNEFYRILSPDKKAVIVVGNSCYSKVVIPTDLLIAEAAKDVGFRIEKIEVLRQLITSGQQWKELDSESKSLLRESMITLTA